jgi:transglutaminase-like putative cysteine protease
MRLAVHYNTSYRFSERARRVIQLLRLTPVTFDGQIVHDWRIDVDVDARLREGRDGFGNITHMLYVDQPVHGLKVSVNGRVTTEDRAGLVNGQPHELPPQVFMRATPLTEADAALRDFAASIGGGDMLKRLHRLNAAIHDRLGFDTGTTDAGTKAAEAFAAGHGVCQDFAHIFIAAARQMNVPARYISGHLFRRDGAPVQEAAHAWVEAYVEDLGWVAFDPTNGIGADDAYIRVACGLDYRDAAPFAGARAGGGHEELDVDVTVRLARAQAQSQSQS